MNEYGASAFIDYNIFITILRLVVISLVISFCNYKEKCVSAIKKTCYLMKISNVLRPKHVCWYGQNIK